RPQCITVVFSSRRRHTRFSRDWSSDVCSSDLAPQKPAKTPVGRRKAERLRKVASVPGRNLPLATGAAVLSLSIYYISSSISHLRSEERRVGKASRDRWGRGH